MFTSNHSLIIIVSARSGNNTDVRNVIIMENYINRNYVMSHVKYLYIC